jgi:hypothetical protein
MMFMFGIAHLARHSDAKGLGAGGQARPLLNDALGDVAAAMAPGNDLMQRRVARRG